MTTAHLTITTRLTTATRPTTVTVAVVAAVDGGGGDGDPPDDSRLPDMYIRDATVTEGDDARFAVRLSESSDTLVTVAFGTVDRTAVAGSDYTSTSGMVRFEPGETLKAIVVPTIDDATVEETERFTVQLSDPSGASIADGTAAGAITDDDEPPGLSIDDAQPVREGEAAEFTVRLSAASDQVGNGRLRDDGRDGGGGLGLHGNLGNAALRAGRDESHPSRVQTIEDATAEETEAFTVQLSDPSGATIADGTAAGTITDDDDPPGLSIDDAQPVREGETAEFTVRLSAASDRLVTVGYETMDGTAVAGSDYTATSGMLRFEPGDTSKTIGVPTIDDATTEETERFTVQLSDPSGATIADGTAAGTITDDDDPPELSIDDAPPVREGETAEFVVRLSAASSAAVTVAYRTADGTAVAGSDYTSTAGMLRFEPGDTSKTIAVQTIERRHVGGNRSVHGAVERSVGRNDCERDRGRDDHGRRRPAGAVDRRCAAGTRR